MAQAKGALTDRAQEWPFWLRIVRRSTPPAPSKHNED
jgi:hypothetical protein